METAGTDEYSIFGGSFGCELLLCQEAHLGCLHHAGEHTTSELAELFGALDTQGLLDDSGYIAGANRGGSVGQNVAPLSISVTAALLAQYVSFSVAPGGLGDPGPLQYVLSTTISTTRSHEYRRLPLEPACPGGDRRQDLTGDHWGAESARAKAAAVPSRIRLCRMLETS